MKTIKSAIMCLAVASAATIFSACSKDHADLDGNYTTDPTENTAFTAGGSNATAAEPQQTITYTAEKLGDVDYILVGGVEVEIISKTDNSVTFKMPSKMFAVEGEVAKEEIKIFNKKDDQVPVYKGDVFIYCITLPIPDDVTNATIQTGDDFANPKATLTFVGQNMDKLTKVTIGGVEAEIVSQTATEIQVKIVGAGFTGTPTSTPNVYAMDILGYYGDRGSNMPLFKGFKLNTYIEMPILTSVTNNTKVHGDDNFYMNDRATLTGDKLGMMEKLLIDGVEVTNFISKSATSVVFEMPDVQFTTAKNCEVAAVYDGGDAQVTMNSTMKIYPFYYWKDVQISTTASSTANYDNGFAWNSKVCVPYSPNDINADSVAFYSPELSKAFSTNTWNGSPAPNAPTKGWDEYAKAGGAFTNQTATDDMLLDKTKVTSRDAYMAIKPYFYAKCTSLPSTLTIVSPQSDPTLLPKHYYYTPPTSGTAWSNKALVSAKGTPLLTFRVINSTVATSDETDFGDKVKNGSIESLYSYNGPISSYTSLLSVTDRAETKFGKGSVVLLQWTSYEKGNKPAVNSDILKTGAIIIKDITYFNEATGKSEGAIRATGTLSSASKIIFDCYWPKNLSPDYLNSIAPSPSRGAKR